MTNDTHKGKVKFFNEAKGFGFIIDSLDNKEYFVHKTNVLAHDAIQENDEVEFDIEQHKKGAMAINVDFPA